MKPIEDKQVVNKTKSIKKEYVFIAVLLVVVIAIFISNGNLFSAVNSGEHGNLDYASKIESKLEKLLSEVQGVGKVKVFVTTDGSFSEVVLKDSKQETVNGEKTTVESVILVGGKPYVTKTSNPNIIGIAVVCQGADSLSVKLNVTEIITTTLSVSADCVRIIKMK
ncbi:MAG: hypothetical protein J6V66_07240 [Clostridia bacterium]|nr:hypothetical protein [Clostridia bacterium]